jgi:hypothetical protein
MCYIIFTTSSSVCYVVLGVHGRVEGGTLGPPLGGLGAVPPRIFFASRNVSHFCLVFHVASIFMSIVGRFFGTWFLSMVFYFWLRN